MIVVHAAVRPVYLKVTGVTPAAVGGARSERGVRVRVKSSVDTLADRIAEAIDVLGPYPKAGRMVSYLAGVFPHKPHAMVPLPVTVF